MRCIKLKRYQNYLLFEEASDALMSILGHFLTDEVGMNRAQFNVELLLDPNFSSVGCNYAFMEKEGGQVIIGCLLDEDPYERALTVPIPVMIDLLTQWDAVCQQHPDEIIVHYIDGTFTVEGKKEQSAASIAK